MEDREEQFRATVVLDGSGCEVDGTLSISDTQWMGYFNTNQPSERFQPHQTYMIQLTDGRWGQFNVGHVESTGNAIR